MPCRPKQRKNTKENAVGGGFPVSPRNVLSAMTSWMDDRSAAHGGGTTGHTVGRDWGDEGKRESVLLAMGKSSKGVLGRGAGVAGAGATKVKRKSSGEEEEEEERKERTPPNMVRGTG